MNPSCVLRNRLAISTFVTIVAFAAGMNCRAQSAANVTVLHCPQLFDSLSGTMLGPTTNWAA